ncbi:MAG: complex I NDUFA9 subunit family protein [Alphaproteobacteria bacterium]|nr:complex I NDUFA9 subunit family protein [Alphaproteobacteria bacterium]
MTRGIVTVVGGSGFLGRHLVRRLAADGWRIRVAVRRPDEAGHLRPMGDVGQIAAVQVNVRDEASVAAAVVGAEAVINLVGILYESGRQTFAEVHAAGPGRIARAAAAAQVRRLVHVSALGASAQSASAYARSKAAGEAEVRAAFPAAIIMRPSIVVGPEDDFFNRFGALARLTPALPLIGGGHTRFQPVLVSDVAEAVVRALDDPPAAGQTFELAGPRVYTMREILEMVLALTRRRRLLVTLPFWLARVQAAVLDLLPVPPLTRDQVALLEVDNVLSGRFPGFSALGMSPSPIEDMAAAVLRRYRRGGASQSHLPA